MFASKSMLVGLAIVAALGFVSAQDESEGVEKCAKLLSDGLTGVSISLEVHDFVQLVYSTLPGVPIEDWATLKHTDDRVQKLEAASPEDQCTELMYQVEEKVEESIKDNAECAKILSEDEPSTLELFMKDTVISHVYEAKEACFAFSA